MGIMDAEIRHARYIMSRLLLDCLRLIDEVRVRSGKLTNDETIIGMAIIVLEYEGQVSASISKLSFFTGVPRATVSRIVEAPSAHEVGEAGWSERCVCSSG